MQGQEVELNEMNLTGLACRRLTEAVWVLLGIYWAYGAMRVKPVARRETDRQRIVHLILMLLAAFLLADPNPAIGALRYRFIPETARVCWTGLGMVIAGCAFAVWARAVLGGNWSASVTVKEGHEVIRKGPYSIVRHPIYTGLLLAVLGTALEVGEIRGLIAFAVAFASLFEKSRREERFMVEEFDGAYVEYRHSVKRIIPFVL